jgi:hypothetical protein
VGEVGNAKVNKSFSKKSLKGRPKYRWRYNIKVGFKDADFEGVE